MECSTSNVNVPEDILRSINFDALEGALNMKFNNRGLLVEAITHGSQLSSSGVPCYKRLELIGDAILADLITRHLFFHYKHLPTGRLTDLRAASVNNEYFARVAVKNNLHVHLRHASTALGKQVFFLFIYSLFIAYNLLPFLSCLSFLFPFHSKLRKEALYLMTEAFFSTFFTYQRLLIAGLTKLDRGGSPIQ